MLHIGILVLVPQLLLYIFHLLAKNVVLLVLVDLLPDLDRQLCADRRDLRLVHDQRHKLPALFGNILDLEYLLLLIIRKGGVDQDLVHQFRQAAPFLKVLPQAFSDFGIKTDIRVKHLPERARQRLLLGLFEIFPIVVNLFVQCAKVLSAIVIQLYDARPRHSLHHNPVNTVRKLCNLPDACHRTHFI